MFKVSLDVALVQSFINAQPGEVDNAVILNPPQAKPVKPTLTINTSLTLYSGDTKKLAPRHVFEHL